MRVKLKKHAAGPDFGDIAGGYAGDVIDIPEATAERLITSGHAERVPEPGPKAS